MNGVDENEKWHQRLGQAVGRSFGRLHDPQSGPVWQRAEGVYLIDVNGKRYIDFRCGYSAINYGHTPTQLIQAAESQMRMLSQLTQLPSVSMIEFAEQLLKFLGWKSTGKVLLNVSGARAVETSLKIALRRRRGYVVCFQYGYHGRSLATQPFSDAASFSEQWPWPGIWNGEICRLPYPTDDTLVAEPASWTEVLQRFEALLAKQSTPLSAVLVEPMLGARGYLAPPDEFFQRLVAIAHKHGGLVIADEVQVGLGRGGGRLTSQSQGWCPDLVVLGKSLGGGLFPISAVIGQADDIDSLPNASESETFAAHPLACAVASAGLRQLESIEPSLPILGEKLREIFRSIVDRWGLPIEVQGRGVVAVLDWRGVWPDRELSPESSPESRFEQATGLRGDRAERLAAIAAAVAAVSRRCLEAGLLLHPSGPAGNRMILLPPLIVNEEQMREAGARFEAALGSFLSK